MKSTNKLIWLISVAFIYWITLSIGAYADDTSLHADSINYRAYLGIVPASMINIDPRLVDGDTSLHGGAGKQVSGTYHVMVAIYDRGSNERISDATVIAKVRPKKILDRNAEVKPLERMVTSGQVTYGNYFRFQGKGKYEIEAKIYESDKNGYEEVEFTYTIK